jgi:4-hydroxy-tetrahydrodipicolinate synthase
VPAVASEVAFLTGTERRQLVEAVVAEARERVPVLLGISDATPARCLAHARACAALEVAAYLVAVPAELYGRPAAVPDFFREVCAGLPGPVVVQDLQFDGPGLAIETLQVLRTIPSIVGVKIETVPAGPKYSQVRAACGGDFWIAGGWAVPQMIEALDRHVDALIPECSMIRVYREVVRRHRTGDRAGAARLFRALLPVLAFTNQEISTSIAFFKRLLTRKGIFRTHVQRLPTAGWDEISECIAAELVELYLQLESDGGAAPRRPAGNG